MMKLCVVVTFAALAGLFAAAPAVALSDCEKQDGFVALFDGQNMDGWVVEGTDSWTVQNGILVCSGEGHGWIRTVGTYRNFTLRLDFRIPQGGNSGVFLRAKQEGDPAFTGLEVQVMGDHGGQPTLHSTGAIYDAVGPSANVTRPAGDWNTFDITYIGNSITVTLNGKTIVAADLFDPAINERLSEERKFPNRVATGFIGMQNHGNKVEYRDVRIRTFDLYSTPENP